MLESLFPIAIFPTGGLASSVIVPVWVGVLVVAFFNLRFGWVLSGLVVPGYLVPMLIVNPILAIVNFAEALIVLVLSMFVSNRVATWSNWSHFFGRDRFFLIVLISVVVRLTLDTWGFDFLADTVHQYTGEQLSFRNDLHSFGLIIIALMSNQMWKVGVLRGSVHMFVTVGITLILVRYVLMTLTNFSLTNLAFMYEEVSVAILASPKSYIILLVSCYVASRMNLRYGWEYAGILVPSLLAIQWYQPLKIMATFAETLVILAVASLLLRNKVIANMDITGARKLVLFFTVSFAYKFSLALSLGVLAPYQKASDFFAFGYLLSTLIAIKMHDKNLVIGMSRTVLQSSLVALMIATGIGFSLFKTLPSLAQIWPSKSDTIQRSGLTEIVRDTQLTTWLIEAKSRAYESRDKAGTPTQSQHSIDRFREAVRLLVNFRLEGSRSDLIAAYAIIDDLGATLAQLEDNYLVIGHERDASFGNYVINLNANAKELLIQAPRGLSERDAYNTALAVFKLSEAAYLAISNGLEISGATDLTNSNSVFSHFQMMTAKNDVVQVRTAARNLETIARRWSRGRAPAPGEVYAWIKDAIPSGLNLNYILQAAPQLSMNWFTPSFTNRQRDLSNGAFIELLLDRGSATKIQTLASLSDLTPTSEEDRLPIDGYLQRWLSEKKLLIAEKQTAAYKTPNLGEMLFLLDEVATELFNLIETERGGGKWTELGYTKLSQINSVLAYFNYQLIQYRDISSKQTFIVMSEIFGPFEAKHWGTYVFRLDADSPLVIEVPRPLFERRTFELGLHAFQELKAKALFIAGAHPQSNADGSSDILRLRNRRSMFSTMHYGLSRYYADYPLHFVQIRSMSLSQQQDNPDYDVVVDGTTDSRAERGDLVSYFTDQELRVKHASLQNDGERFETVSELGLNSQTAQLRYQRNKSFSVAWISPEVRQRFRRAEALERLANQLVVSGISIVRANAIAVIDESELSTEGVNGISDETLEHLMAYADNHNIVDLHNAIENDSINLVGIDDTVSGQLILKLSSRSKVIGFLNLNPVSQTKNNARDLERDWGRHFIEGRYAWLSLER